MRIICIYECPDSDVTHKQIWQWLKSILSTQDIVSKQAFERSLSDFYNDNSDHFNSNPEDVFISVILSHSAQEPSTDHTPPQLSPSLSQSTYTTGGSLDVPHIIMQGDARRRRNDSYFDDIPRSKLERQMAQVRVTHFCWYPWQLVGFIHSC